MNNENKYRIRLIILALIIILIVIFFRLFNMQVINSEEYIEQSERRVSATMTQKAPRGEIMDRNGDVLVSNREGYSVMLQKIICTNSELNDKMLKILDVFEKYQNPYTDSLPISSYPFEYIFSDDNGNGSTGMKKAIGFLIKRK